MQAIRSPETVRCHLVSGTILQFFWYFILVLHNRKLPSCYLCKTTESLLYVFSNIHLQNSKDLQTLSLEFKKLTLTFTVSQPRKVLVIHPSFKNFFFSSSKSFSKSLEQEIIKKLCSCTPKYSTKLFCYVSE